MSTEHSPDAVPDTPADPFAESLQQAIACHQAGQLPEAEQGYRAILAEQPGHPDALHNLGILAMQVGEMAVALNLLKTVLEHYPQHAQFWLSYLQALIQADQIDTARQVLAQGRELGLQGDAVDALAAQLAVSQEIAIAAAEAEALHDAPTEQQHPADGAETLVLEPSEAAPAGDAQHPDSAARVRQEETLALPAQASADPEPEPIAPAVADPDLATSGALDSACADTANPAGQGVVSGPDLAPAPGWTFTPLPDSADAATCDDALTPAEPGPPPSADDGPGYLAQGEAALTRLHYTDAWRALQQACRCLPEHAPAWLRLAQASYGLGRLEEAERHFRQALALDAGLSAAHSGLLLLGQHHSGLDADGAAQQHRALGQALEQRWPIAAARPAAPPPGRGLRVGFVAASLYDHPHAHVLLPLWQALASGSLEVLAYNDSPVQDAITTRLRAACAGWREVYGQDDDSLLAQIQADQVDILIDLSGHLPGNRLEVFARQAAPLQVSWLGYPDSSGLSRMHWRLTDAIIDPPGTETRYSEQLWRLPDSAWCYQPLWHVLQQRPSSDYAVCATPALHRGYVTFGASQHAACLGPEVIALWAQVLHAVPDSRLLLELDGLEAGDGPLHLALTTQFVERGIGAHRLQLVARTPGRQAVRAHDMDIALDSFPVSAGLASCELLWMGVPLVTLPGPRAASRSGASLLTTLGYPQWIAHSKVDYVRIAKTLASDLARLNRIRLGLRVEMESSPLRQAQRFAEQMETALHSMWDGRQAGSGREA